jgi:multiple sugar transport system substrate-binding protein
MLTSSPDLPVSRRSLLRAGGLALAAGAAGPALSACARTPDAPDGESGGGTFTLYTNPAQVYETWKDVVKKFEADHKVTVNWQKFQWPDMQTKVQTDFSAGNAADLVQQPNGARAVAFAKDGEVLALDDYLAKDGAALGFPADWQEEAVKSWQLDGKTYGIQMNLTCHQLYYNKKMLDAAGITTPPATWDQFLAAAKQLTKGGVSGFAINQDYSYSWPWMIENGVTLFDESTRDFLTPHDAALETMQFLADLVHKHKVSPVPVSSNDPSGPRNLLVAGRAAMIITGPWDIKPIRTSGKDIVLGLGQPLRRKALGTALAGAGMFIPKKAKHPDLAWDLMKRLNAPETELKLTKEAGQTMPRRSWASLPEIKNDPTLAAVAQALPTAKNWYGDLAATGKVNQVDDAYKTFFQSTVLSGEPVEPALQKFLDAAKKVVGA